MNKDLNNSTPSLDDKPAGENIRCTHGPRNEGLKLEVLDNLQLLLGRDSLKGVLESYLQRASLHIQKAKEHLDRREMENLHFVAHTLNGSSANMGVVKLAELSATLDNWILQKRSVLELERQLGQIEEQFELSRNALAKFMESRIC